MLRWYPPWRTTARRDGRGERERTVRVPPEGDSVRSGNGGEPGRMEIEPINGQPGTGGGANGADAFDRAARNALAAGRTVTLEAEDASLTGAVIARNHTGYTGAGFVDYKNPAGDAVEWTLESEAAGTATLNVRYALGANAPRAMLLEVNGEIEDGSFNFTPTGGWTAWDTLSIQVPVREGGNVIRLVAQGDSGPNVDSLTVAAPAGTNPGPAPTPDPPAPTPPAPNPPAPTPPAPGGDVLARLQAENAALTGATIETFHTGAAGGAYVDYRNPTGDAVEWTVETDRAGPADLSLRYALGASSPRTMALEVNGTVVDDAVAFGPTGGWKSWGDLSRSVDLAAGNNSIRLVATGDSGPNVDELTVAYGTTDGPTDPTPPTPTLPTPTPNPPTTPTPGPGGSALDARVAVAAERGTLSGAVEATNHASFEGRSFVDFVNATGDAVAVEVQADRAGEADLSIRYALGSPAPRTMALEVNGEVVQDVAFTQTGTWDDWGSVNVSGIALRAGSNDVRLVATGDSGPNVDTLRFAPAGTGGSAPELRGVTTGTGLLPDGATNVATDSAFAVGIVAATEADAIDANTVSTRTVTLTAANGTAVAGSVNTTGGRDAITFTPNANLAASTTYTLRVDGVRNEAGEAYVPLTRTFTTGTGATAPTAPTEVSFDRRVVASGSDQVASVLVSPNSQHLYGTTLTGDLLRWDIDQATGDLSNRQSFTVPGGNRTLIGMAFDPNDANRLWFSNNSTVFTGNGPEYSGKISYIDIAPGGAFQGQVTDYVQGLPRSVRDHLTNGLDFGPDGFLYVTQGGNSAMGAPDNAWGNRPESLLSAAALRVDTGRNAPPGGFNVRTDAAGGYDPSAPGAPVTLFGTGLRNSYDLEWHSNGQLYIANNGSNTGGNSPDDPRTARDEGLTDGFKQPDYLFRVTEGGYYGHPNPSRGEYIRDGGNPTAGVDLAEVVTVEGREGYEVGVQPEANYRGFAYDFGFNRSPNGTVEYRSNAFGGALQNKLLVAEYSGGDRILALTPGGNGDIADAFTIADGFDNPLDITVHEPTGRIYVAEQRNRGNGDDDRIILLQPNAGPTA